MKRTRFQATNRGAMWHVIDRFTGRTVGFGATHEAALRRVRMMERRAA